MIFNQDEIFSDKQAITATTESTNIIDLGIAGTPYDGKAPLNRDVGKGNMVPLLVQVTEDFNNATSVTISILNRDTEAAGTVADETIVSQVITLAELKAGKQFAYTCLPNQLTGRYLAIHYTVTGPAPSTGAVTASITMGVQTNITGA